MSSNPQTEKYEAIGARIADGRPLDWERIADAGTDDALLAGMRLIERVMQSHRQLESDPAVSAAGDARRESRHKFGVLDVIEPLNSGAEGDVWRAYDPLLDKDVALKLHKVQSGDLAHKFLEEARKLARIRHSNVVHVYGAAVHDFRAGIWIELIHGKSLAQLLLEHGPFSAEDVRAIGLDLCAALSAVHDVGLIHGDVKPENIMREHSGRIVLLDFGSAHEIDDARSARVISGTTHYIAPEVLNGLDRSPASDVYALGAVLFRLLTGEFPYDGNDPAELQRAHTAGLGKRLADLQPGLPTQVSNAIDRALERNSGRRFSGMPAFADALRSPPTPTPSPTKKKATLTFLIVATAALVSAGIAFAVPYWHSLVDWNINVSLYDANSTGADALPPHAHITPDDHLELRLRSNHQTYLYVFDNDGSDKAEVLFPLSGVDPQNPLAASVDYRIPGKLAGNDVTWQIKSLAAHEEIIVIASDHALTDLSTHIASWQHAEQNEASRGNAQLVAVPSGKNVANSRLNSALRDLLDGSDNVHVRYWRFELNAR